MMIHGGGAEHVGIIGGSQAPVGLHTSVAGPCKAYPSSQLKKTDALILNPSLLNNLPLDGLGRGLHCVGGRGLAVVVVVVVLVVDDGGDVGLLVPLHVGGSGCHLRSLPHVADCRWPSKQA